MSIIPVDMPPKTPFPVPSLLVSERYMPHVGDSSSMVRLSKTVSRSEVQEITRQEKKRNKTNKVVGVCTAAHNTSSPRNNKAAKCSGDSKSVGLVTGIQRCHYFERESQTLS